MDAVRRPSALGQAALPDWRRRSRRAIRSGTASRRARPSRPRPHVREPVPRRASSAESLGKVLRLVGGRHCPRHALVRDLRPRGAPPSRSRARRRPTRTTGARRSSRRPRPGEVASRRVHRRARPPPTTPSKRPGAMPRRRPWAPPTCGGPCHPRDPVGRRDLRGACPAHAEGRDRGGELFAADRDRLGAAVRFDRPSRREREERVGRRGVLDDVAAFELDRGERGWRRRRECGLVLFVLGERIRRLPRRAARAAPRAHVRRCRRREGPRRAAPARAR